MTKFSKAIFNLAFLLAFLCGVDAHADGKEIDYSRFEQSAVSGDTMSRIEVSYEGDASNEHKTGIESGTERRIICDDIDESGLGSAYKSHVFRLENTSSITSCEWSFVLYGENNEEIIISTATSPIFSISAIENPDNFKRNSNGDIIGFIKCNYNIGGKQSSASFSVFLELKPVILSIDNKEIHQAEDYEGYYLTFDVYYKGSDTVYIDLEEEYSSSLRSQIVHSPYKASVKTGYINPYNYAWVHIRVYNKYGEAVETIELEPLTGTIETFDYEISNINYDYTVDYQNGKYDISGEFSFDVKVSNATEFIIAHTDPRSSHKHFYSVRMICEGDPEGTTEEHYSRPETRPETFFRLSIRKEDGKLWHGPEICTTDYIREEDKNLYLSGISAPAISSGVKAEISNSKLHISSESGIQLVRLIDINGVEVKHVESKDTDKCDIELSDISNGFYIVSVIDCDGISYNKKIIY